MIDESTYKVALVCFYGDLNNFKSNFESFRKRKFRQIKHQVHDETQTKAHSLPNCNLFSAFIESSSWPISAFADCRRVFATIKTWPCKYDLSMIKLSYRITVGNASNQQ